MKGRILFSLAVVAALSSCTYASEEKDIVDSYCLPDRMNRALVDEDGTVVRIIKDTECGS